MDQEYYERQRRLAQSFISLADEVFRSQGMRTEVFRLDIRTSDRFECEIGVFLLDNRDTKAGELTISVSIKSNLLKEICQGSLEQTERKSDGRAA